MAAALKLAWKGYTFLFDELPDQRTKSLFLAAKPYEVITLLAIYLMFVLKWGPQWMKTRPAFNLNKLMIIYNVVQVLISAYIFVMAIVLAWGWNYQWICEPVDFSNNENAVKMAYTVHFYFMVKIFDLLDTVFFVLRKKSYQVSFLHVYHHAGMVALLWGATTYLPGGHGTFIGLINSLVHMVMYTYYLLTIAVPSIKQSLWWKKYITQLQIFQFFVIVVHMSTLVFKTDCAYPRWTTAIFLPQNFFILVLFIDFYIKTYVRNPKIEKTNGDANNGVRSQLCRDKHKN